jgi:hypothetical protein
VGKSFKLDTDKFEETTRTKRFGNSRKLQSDIVRKERRAYRRKIEKVVDKQSIVDEQHRELE